MRNKPSLEFVDLIAPLTPEAFFRDVWEQRPLVQRCRAGESFASLLSWETADQLIYAAGPQRRTVRLFRDGAWLPEASYAVAGPPGAAADGMPTSVADPARVFEQFRRGASIHLRDLQATHPPMARFCRQLEQALGFPVGATAFLSPPNLDPKRGEPRFAVHYDEQDQFILQVSGSKRWRIYDAPYPLPLGDQGFEAMGAVPGDCQQELTLRAGDVIYLPRGHLHEVVTADEPSLHLSFFVETYRWIDALRAALEALRDDVRFRRAIPVRAVTGEGAAEFSARFEEIKRLALDELRAEVAAECLRRSFFRAHRPVLDGHLRDWLGLDQVDADTVVGRRPGALCEVSEDGQATVRLGPKRIGDPSLDPASLRFIASRTSLRVADIPGPLDDAGKIALARRLIRRGVLEVAAPAAADR